MAKDEYKLKFVIDGDGTTASQALKSVTGEVNKFGGVLTSTFGGLVPVLGAVEAGVLAVGAAVVTVGTTLYKLSRVAEEYGSTIYDASVKTGLHAEALSAMRLAGEQSDTSFEQITKGIGKFTLTVSQAADGSKEAAANIKKLGLDPKKAIDDLDGSLGKVFSKIQATENPFQKAGLAAAAFGAKMGKELLPFIDQFNGNLPALIEHAKKMGAVIGDDDAAAADKFGDTMKDLDAQLGSVGRTIGQAVIPEFTKMAEYISQWLADNQDQITSWGKTTKYALDGVIGYWEDLITAVKKYQTESGVAGAGGGIPAAKGMSYAYDPNSKFNLFGALIDRGKAYDAAQPLKGSLRGFLSPSLLGPDVADPGKAKKEIFKLSSQGKAIVDAANQLGISPLDLATIISFESAGTYSPSVKGGAGGKYKGLIQFGPQEQAKYGVRPGQSFENQVTTSVVQFLKDRFASVGRSTAGASLLDLYRTVIGGNPNASLTAKDAFGTSALSGVQKMLTNNRPDALKRFFGGSESNAKGSNWGGIYSAAEQAELEKEKMLEAERIKNFEEGERRRVEIGQSMSQSLIELQQQEYESALKYSGGAEAYAASNKLHELRMSQIDDEIKAMEDRAARTEAGSEEEKRLIDEITLKKIERDRIERRSMDDLDKRRQEIFERDMERDLKRLQNEQDIQKALEEQTRQRMLQAGMVPGFDKNGNPTAQAPGQGGHNSLLDAITGGLGRSPIEALDAQGNAVYSLSNAYQHLGQMAGDAIGQLSQGLGNMIQQWVLYGSAGPDAMRKMTAGVLAGLAAQASVEALMELARGFAALANPFLAWTAPLHFKAAAIFGGIGIGAALAGRAVAGDTFTKGTSAASGSGGGSSASSQSLSPYSRVSATAYYSGRNSSNDRLASAIERFNQKVDAARPGDVFMKGMRQNPGAVGAQNARDAQTHPDGARQFLSSAGFNRRG